MYLSNVRESVFFIYIFPSLLNKGQLVKEIICSSGYKFLPFRADPILELFRHSGKQKGSHIFSFFFFFFLFDKNSDECGVIFIHL